MTCYFEFSLLTTGVVCGVFNTIERVEFKCSKQDLNDELLVVIVNMSSKPET